MSTNLNSKSLQRVPGLKRLSQHKATADEEPVPTSRRKPKKHTERSKAKPRHRRKLVEDEAAQSGSEGHEDEEEGEYAEDEHRMVRKMEKAQRRMAKRGNGDYRPSTTEGDDESDSDDTDSSEVDEDADALDDTPMDEDAEAAALKNHDAEYYRLREKELKRRSRAMKQKMKSRPPSDPPSEAETESGAEGQDKYDRVLEQLRLQAESGAQTWSTPSLHPPHLSQPAALPRQPRDLTQVQQELESHENEDAEDLTRMLAKQTISTPEITNRVSAPAPRKRPTNKRASTAYSDEELDAKDPDTDRYQEDEREALRLDEEEADLTLDERVERANGNYKFLLISHKKYSIKLKPEEVELFVKALEIKWGTHVDMRPRTPYETMESVGYPKLFGDPTVESALCEQVKKHAEDMRLEWSLLVEVIRRSCKIDDERTERMWRILRVILACQEIAFYTCSFREAARGSGSANTQMLSPFMANVVPIDLMKQNSVGQVWLHAAFHIERSNLLLHNDDLYEQVRNHKNQNTQAYHKHDDVKTFLYRICDKYKNYNMWVNITKPGTVELTTKHITQGWDYDIPRLKRNRRVWSFRNGIYDSRVDKFYPYGSPDMPRVITARYIDVDFTSTEPIGQHWTLSDDGTRGYDQDNRLVWEEDSMDPELATKPAPSYMSIKTEVFDGILNHQGFELPVQQMLWVMMGRMTVELGDKKEGDNWQVFPYLWGIAGTGKSTIWQHWMRIYLSEDTAAVANNIEPTFGLEPIVGKNIWYCLEVKKNFRLEQALFQSMVGGEEMSIAGKNKKAQTTRWNVPGCAAGNQMFSYGDKSGSIARRLFAWLFDHVIDKDQVDTTLLDRLWQEIPNHIRKATQAYRYFKTFLGPRGIWTVAPDYFKATQQRIRQETDPVCRYLAEHCLVVTRTDKSYLTSPPNANTMVKYKEFEAKFSKWHKEQGIQSEPLGEVELQNALKVNSVILSNDRPVTVASKPNSPLAAGALAPQSGGGMNSLFVTCASTTPDAQKEVYLCNVQWKTDATQIAGKTT